MPRDTVGVGDSVPTDHNPAAESWAIDASDLVKTYARGVTALDGVSLQVRKGEVFGLLGPNGAGKTTVVKVLTTLASPNGGTATVAGHDVLRHPTDARRAIGVVSQRSSADPDASGRDNLMLQGRMYGMGGDDLRQRVDDLLERFNLADFATRRVRTYSGGMQRKLEVALSLVHRPEVLFLDEPTTGLDPEVRADMWQEIARLAQQETMTILLTTHYLEEADALADRLAIIDRGRVVATGTPNELKGELLGDSVHVTLAPSASQDMITKAVAALEGVAGLTHVQADGQNVWARTRDGGAAIPEALAALGRIDAPIAGVTTERPSLDDVYLHYAGRRLAADTTPGDTNTADAGSGERS